MVKYIDAEVIEKEGWYMQRIRQEDSHTMVLETKKPSEFPFANVVEQKRDEWILSSERLPENDDWKIVTIKDESGDSPYLYTDLGWYLDAAECWIIEAEQRTDVIAWMNLPNPYTKNKKVCTVERKKSKWLQDILISTNGGTYGVKRCSNCESCYHDVGCGWNFCPNCGADMRGDKDG